MSERPSLRWGPWRPTAFWVIADALDRPVGECEGRGREGVRPERPAEVEGAPRVARNLGVAA